MTQKPKLKCCVWNVASHGLWWPSGGCSFRGLWSSTGCLVE